MNIVLLMLLTGLVVWILLPDEQPWWKEDDWDDGLDDAEEDNEEGSIVFTIVTTIIVLTEAAKMRVRAGVDKIIRFIKERSGE